MPKFAIIFGLLLIALGLTAYFGSDLSSQADETSTEGKKRSAITGLAIPASFGSLLLICGLVGLKDSARKHAMHAAAMVGLLGALGTIGKGGYDVYKLANGNDVNARAMTFVWLMAILCILFVALCVKSFIDARKRREAEEAAATTE